MGDDKEVAWAVTSAQVYSLYLYRQWCWWWVRRIGKYNNMIVEYKTTRAVAAPPPTSFPQLLLVQSLSLGDESGPIDYYAMIVIICKLQCYYIRYLTSTQGYYTIIYITSPFYKRMLKLSLLFYKDKEFFKESYYWTSNRDVPINQLIIIFNITGEKIVRFPSFTYFNF